MATKKKKASTLENIGSFVVFLCGAFLFSFVIVLGIKLAAILF